MVQFWKRKKNRESTHQFRRVLYFFFSTFFCLSFFLFLILILAHKTCLTMFSADGKVIFEVARKFNCKLLLCRPRTCSGNKTRYPLNDVYWHKRTHDRLHGSDGETHHACTECIRKWVDYTSFIPESLPRSTLDISDRLAGFERACEAKRV